MNDIIPLNTEYFFYLYDNHYTLIEIYLEQYFMPWIGVYHGEMDVIQWKFFFFISRPGGLTSKKV